MGHLIFLAANDCPVPTGPTALLQKYIGGRAVPVYPRPDGDLSEYGQGGELRLLLAGTRGEQVADKAGTV